MSMGDSYYQTVGGANALCLDIHNAFGDAGTVFEVFSPGISGGGAVSVSCRECPDWRAAPGLVPSGVFMLRLSEHLHSHVPKEPEGDDILLAYAAVGVAL